MPKVRRELKLLYYIINWYTQHLPFPHKGWKYFYSMLRFLGLDKETYKKKIADELYFNVTPADHIQKNIFWYGAYEKDTLNCLCKLIKSDSTVFDIGANVGYYTVLMASRACNGHVYAFEPLSIARNQLQKNIALNKIRNTTVLDFCISDKQESSVIYAAWEDNIGMSGLKPPENFSGRTEPVECMSFDEWFLSHRINSANLIKIDVEGAEVKVLRGMSNTIKKHRPILILEVISPQLVSFGATVEELYDLIIPHDYSAYRAEKKNKLKKLTCVEEGYDIFFIPNDNEIPADIGIV